MQMRASAIEMSPEWSVMAPRGTMGDTKGQAIIPSKTMPTVIAAAILILISHVNSIKYPFNLESLRYQSRAGGSSIFRLLSRFLGNISFRQIGIGNVLTGWSFFIILP